MYTQASSSAHADDDHMYTQLLLDSKPFYQTIVSILLLYLNFTTPAFH